MGYCLTSMDVALKLLLNEPELIKTEEKDTNWVE
jgi:hypothetical protein